MSVYKRKASTSHQYMYCHFWKRVKVFWGATHFNSSRIYRRWVFFISTGLYSFMTDFWLFECRLPFGLFCSTIVCFWSWDFPFLRNNLTILDVMSTFSWPKACACLTMLVSSNLSFRVKLPNGIFSPVTIISSHPVCCTELKLPSWGSLTSTSSCLGLGISSNAWMSDFSADFSTVSAASNSIWDFSMCDCWLESHHSQARLHAAVSTLRGLLVNFCSIWSRLYPIWSPKSISSVSLEISLLVTSLSRTWFLFDWVISASVCLD